MKQFLALALIGLCCLSCEPAETENSSTSQATSEPVATESTTEQPEQNT